MARLALVLSLSAALILAWPALALAQNVKQVQTTQNYKIELDIVPVAVMLTPDQAKTAKAGEVMVQMSGMPMPSMSMTDQGQPVNHHLEVHVFNKATGQVLTNVTPVITITNASGSSRQLGSVTPMYDVAVGQSDYHYGNNVYL